MPILICSPMVRRSKKGQCHEIFCFWFFFMGQFPPSPRVSNKDRFKFLKKFMEIFASQCASPVYDTGGQICHRCQRHRRQILPPVSLVLLKLVANLPPVSTIQAANLPPVSTTQVATCQQYQRHRQQICHLCQRHQWKNMETISGSKILKVKLKAKIYIYVNSNTQKVSKQNN